ncbi:response regulator transcription factor [Enterococcus sp. 669A]|uniref:Response regulator transcription factor n=1 Tax=Candidatus Enterococcus moelleringii TaxID=2815325 RepID=A0ABS3LC58_9ENTE|nr:LytTR family DNA-binding domain-containing protein [Enterococcus sp. 669A]MBO1306660.1 response regulator transcription factor [Enterococcus sp. 669A]
MMKVFICEDESPLRAFYKGHIERQIMIKELDASMTLSTDKPREILAYLRENRDTTGIYFLDINLGEDEMDGIILAKEIRKYDALGKIIFITTHDEMVPLTFKHKVEALDFIIKDTVESMQAAITECLDTIFEKQKVQPEKRQQYMIKTGKSERYVNYEDILFFETSPKPHVLYVYTSTGRIPFYGAIKETVDLGDNFERVHKSYVVNLDNVRSIDKEMLELTMHNGQRCAISRKKMKMVRDYLNLE